MGKHICNLCGFPCSPPEESSLNNDMGLIDAYVCGGYDSTAGNGYGALDDTVEYRFSLCEFCLDWLFEKFQIPVEVRDYIGGEEIEPWRPALQRVKEDEWRKYRDRLVVERSRRRGNIK